MSKMSGDELAVLRKTWDIYITDMATNGCDAFIRLFDENPTFRAWFPKMVGELRDNPAVIRNAESDFLFISGLIDNYIEQDKGEARKNLAKWSGCHHKNNVTAEMLGKFRDVLLDELKIKLGPEVMDEATNSTWAKFFETVMASIYH
ncbi:unnamed protein product [Oppiella nova]|uniref:Globin domain-containing protein n=1 Tax=Oppiella nova TaxID=334625 RepID=A0A7R9M419_9ACAR|nr:unnamed protein product [Oppiella nova]CAG2170382.1 unnamed protein product [Oppiella nova]